MSKKHVEYQTLLTVIDTRLTKCQIKEILLDDFATNMPDYYGHGWTKDDGVIELAFQIDNNNEVELYIEKLSKGV
jgi:hypothetical protein